MSFKVITLREKDKWLSYLNKLPISQQDIYYTPHYYELYQSNGYGKAACFVFMKDNDIAIYPYLINSINDSGYDLDDNYYDIQGAYGYNGIISSNYTKSFRKNFYKSFDTYCKENNIIAEFIRYNPIIENHVFADSFVDLSINRKTVVLNINQPYNDIWSLEYSSNNRNMIRKAKNTIFCKYDYGKDEIESFFKMYNYTMKRIGAENFYFFKKNFFNQMKNCLHDNFYLITAYEKKINDPIAGLLLLQHQDKAHYFLSARSLECKNNSVNNYLLDYAIRLAKDINCNIFHLGGGNSLDENDTLLKFKKNISKQTCNFYISKKIYNPKIYNKVSSIWEKNNPSKIKQYNNFLLKYNE